MPLISVFFELWSMPPASGVPRYSRHQLAKQTRGDPGALQGGDFLPCAPETGVKGNAVHDNGGSGAPRSLFCLSFCLCTPLPDACQHRRFRSPKSLEQPEDYRARPVGLKVMAGNGLFKPKPLILGHRAQFRSYLSCPLPPRSLAFLHISGTQDKGPM